jgi:hypothetical protein
LFTESTGGDANLHIIKDDVRLGEQRHEDDHSNQFWSQCFTDVVKEKLSGDHLKLASASTAIKKPTGVLINIFYDASGEPSPKVSVQYPDNKDNSDGDDDDATKTLLEVDDKESNSNNASDVQQPESDITNTADKHNTELIRCVQVCCPPPIFMLLISALQIGMYFTQDSISCSGIPEFKYSQLVYDPCMRYQVITLAF